MIIASANSQPLRSSAQYDFFFFVSYFVELIGTFWNFLLSYRNVKYEKRRDLIFHSIRIKLIFHLPLLKTKTMQNILKM